MVVLGSHGQIMFLYRKANESLHLNGVATVFRVQIRFK
ncbi:MAG: hypothetical protein CFH41_02745 [Alphaproteobacteria bacterium MarineAlpha11_Bin1]|nr:MAG: hypothetical protein CFH41_02745 [Alphaproteobacteria bacterium MarineAlpha11_Bin1]